MRVLVFQHLAVEHPGSFRDFWAERGVEWTAVELDAGEPIPLLEGFDLLAVMGGPMDVWEEDEHPWLVAEKTAIRRWVTELGRPYFGICLGHQLLAVACGGEAARMARPEVGLGAVELTEEGGADPLFADLPRKLETFQWHGVEVTKLPERGVALARNGACAVQAMRVGRHAYGVQFHPEIVAETVADWERIPEYMASLVKALGAEAAGALAAVVTPRLPAFAETARRLERNLVAVIENAKTS
ncbi:type 1 glutamine amidotransferase [Chelatococcus sambhunathii]|uniref:Type 1 glutamine amidotransferase n=1 Tax=Chelatococcus sambhunathii TaxID=363953 RepID=A0ABU1DC22_9HYPH|nr:type 1 glutamine amidotransferase [Chelatococcus sambhunathii]MDR4305627.1 type 1 glutamine amidotransferase [Chelatococcus sambhunathii]